MSPTSALLALTASALVITLARACLAERRRQAAYDNGYDDGRSSLLGALPFEGASHQLGQQREVTGLA